jgi:hypothetical protein
VLLLLLSLLLLLLPIRDSLDARDQSLLLVLLCELLGTT